MKFFFNFLLTYEFNSTAHNKGFSFDNVKKFESKIIELKTLVIKIYNLYNMYI